MDLLVPTPVAEAARQGDFSGQVRGWGELPAADAAILAIDRVMAAQHPIAVAFSSGKDSSVVANLALIAAARRRRAGLHVPKMLVLHSDTLVENPEVRKLADRELAKIRRFAKKNDIDLEVRIGQPLLYVSWAVRVIGGRALPSFSTSSRDCSVEWKVAVGQRLQNEVFAELTAIPGAQKPVLMTGVRKEESTVRAASIASRQERSEEIWANDKGQLRLSPILEWTGDDVFEYLGYAGAGIVESYSDYEATLQFYRDAGGSSCAVVADMKLQDAAKQSGGCGARSGCWNCVRVAKDKSLEQMIESNREQYGYMEGLNRLRNFIAATQFDWSKRTYLGRTIDPDGMVAIQADTYSPDMLEALLRMMLTLQEQEKIAARREGVPPRFSVIGTRELIAIDALWSLYGLHKPFHALWVAEDVARGNWMDVPVVPHFPHTPTPRFGKLHVGTAWEDDRKTGDPVRDRMTDGGIRSPVHEMFAECGTGVKETSSGSLVTDWNTGQRFDVDEEGASDWLGFFSDEYIDRYHNDEADRTTAVMTYLSYGFLEPANASLSRWHEIARRTQWMQRHGLVGQVQLEQLKAYQAMQAIGQDPFGTLHLKRERPVPTAADPAPAEPDEAESTVDAPGFQQMSFGF